MPNSLYIEEPTIYGFCPHASIAGMVPREAGPTTVNMTGLTTPYPTPIRAGMAVMVNDEIMSVISFTSGTVTLGRGCCDTVPAEHPTGSIIWFFDDALASNETEYLPTATISVKPLPRTSSSAVPIPNSPPQAVTFNQRFARPYPPARLRMNGVSIPNVVTMGYAVPTLAISWASRNRITQQDVLLHHENGSVAAEAGTTYTLQLFRTVDGSLRRTFAAIPDNDQDYAWADALVDFAVAGVDVPGYGLLFAVRDGLASWQGQRFDFIVQSPPTITTEGDVEITTESDDPLIA